MEFSWKQILGILAMSLWVSQGWAQSRKGLPQPDATFMMQKKVKDPSNGEIRIILEAHHPDGYILPQAPISITLKPKDLILSKQTLRGGDAQSKGPSDKPKKLEFSVSYSDSKKGANVEGQVDFFFCTPLICERRKLQTSVDF